MGMVISDSGMLFTVCSPDEGTPCGVPWPCMTTEADVADRCWQRDWPFLAGVGRSCRLRTAHAKSASDVKDGRAQSGQRTQATGTSLSHMHALT